MLACFAFALRVRSIRRRGVWSEDLLYFFLCAALAALLLSPHLVGVSRVSFAEESQVTGVDRVPGFVDQIGFGYAALWATVEPVVWLLLPVAMEMVARFWAGRGGLHTSAAQLQPRQTFSAAMAKPLLLSLCLFVGPALILWAGLRVALADPSLVYSENEPIGNLAFLHVYALQWLVVLFGFYCWPARLLMPDWAHRSVGGHPWANPSPRAYFGPADLQQLGFPGDLFAFLIVATPWILLAALLLWFRSSLREPGRGGPA